MRSSANHNRRCPSGQVDQCLLVPSLDDLWAPAHFGRVRTANALRPPLSFWIARLRLALSGTTLFILVLATGSCRDFVVQPPPLPESAQALAPLAVYQSWWTETEECSGASGALARVHWFVVPESNSFTYQGVRYDGYWWSDVHWITLASTKVQDPYIVRHEMLHDLLGRGDHPAEYFQRRCGGVVACNESCRSDE